MVDAAMISAADPAEQREMAYAPACLDSCDAIGGRVSFRSVLSPDDCYGLEDSASKRADPGRGFLRLSRELRFDSRRSPGLSEGRKESTNSRRCETQHRNHQSGEVGEMNLVSGNPALVPSAAEAVMQWRYAPCRLIGEPVEVKTAVIVPFTLAQ
ncbi:MAG: hypothetical protein ABSG56_24920 [Bryobacteraceae bacterium]|jgi:hypothetical protein